MTQASAIQRLIAIAAVCAMSLAISAPAWAGFKLAFTEDKYINVGVGLRTAFNANGTDGQEWSKRFSVENFRLYTNGQVLPMLAFEANLDYSEGNNIAPGSQQDGVVTLLDGIVKFELNDYFNIWGGQFLPPSDRANLSGPYYLNTWAFPFVQKYPAVYAGRDRGAAFWGQIQGGKFKYQVGIFDGQDNTPKDTPLVAARLVLNLLDPEPGYYNASTYYGTKDILALGFVFQQQTDGANPNAVRGTDDFLGWNFDLLAEKRLGDEGSAGTVTLDGAFYWYDLDGAAYVPNQSLNDGYGYTIFLGYLMPWKVGYKSLKGQFQPHFQWQDFHFKGNPVDNAGASVNPRDRQRIDVGIHYVLDSFNARATLVYFNERPSNRNTNYTNGVTLAMQIQF